MNKKENLLLQLQQETLISLKPSAIHGIGVFALVDIPAGVDCLFSNDKSEWIHISTQEVDLLPPQSKALIENFCLYDDDGYFVPEYGFKMMDLSVYLNHSDSPNLISLNEGERFKTIKNIKAGDELLIDYGTIVD